MVGVLRPRTRDLARGSRGVFYLRRKTISGWSNYSGKVTNLNICENKMDNRGSKSTILNSIVIKEQRVDGSWSVKSNLTDLRCTLKGFERNRGINHNFSRQMCWSSRVKIPFKQFRLYPVVSLRGYVSRWSDPLEAKWGEGKVKYSTSTSLCRFVNRPQSRSMHEISVNPGVWSGLIDGGGGKVLFL